MGLSSTPAVQPRACNVLRATNGGELVVAADFAAAGRPSATVTELVALLETDCTIWETAPPPYGEEVGMAGTDHVARWLADVRAARLPVRAIVGFCTGSLYAAAMWRKITGWQAVPPRLILIDPELSTRQPLFDHYQRVITIRLANALTRDQARSALARGHAALTRPGTPLALAGEISLLCREIVEPALAGSGIAPARATEFVELFTAYLHWLAAAAELDVVPIWQVATAVNSNTPGSGLDTFPEPQRATLVRRAINLDIPHRELLRSGEAAKVIDELLS